MCIQRSAQTHTESLLNVTSHCDTEAVYQTVEEPGLSSHDRCTWITTPFLKSSMTLDK